MVYSMVWVGWNHWFAFAFIGYLFLIFDVVQHWDTGTRTDDRGQMCATLIPWVCFHGWSDYLRNPIHRQQATGNPIRTFTIATTSLDGWLTIQMQDWISIPPLKENLESRDCVAIDIGSQTSSPSSVSLSGKAKGRPS